MEDERQVVKVNDVVRTVPVPVQPTQGQVEEKDEAHEDDEKEDEAEEKVAEGSHDDLQDDQVASMKDLPGGIQMDLAGA